jgi:hypothetical protein
MSRAISTSMLLYVQKLDGELGASGGGAAARPRPASMRTANSEKFPAGDE